jgi:hypothetical protein
MINTGMRLSACSLRSYALVARRMQCLRQGRAAGKQHIYALANRAVPQGLRQVALAGGAGSYDQHGRALAHAAPCGQIVHQSAVELGQPFKVKLLQRLGGPELGFTHAHAKAVLLTAGDLIAQQDGQELG